MGGSERGRLGSTEVGFAGRGDPLCASIQPLLQGMEPFRSPMERSESPPGGGVERVTRVGRSRVWSQSLIARNGTDA